MTLPLELVLLVLGNLRYNVRALRACSLVCRDWTEACQAHLFRSGVVVRPGCDIGPSLLALNRKAALRRALVHLTVYASQQSFLSSFHISLPNLHTLSVKSEGAESRDIYVDANTLGGFMELYPSIQDLCLVSVSLCCSRALPQQSVVALPVKRLNTFSYVIQCSPLHRLMHVVSMPYLEEAHFAVFDIEDGESITNVLAQCPNLRKLQIDIATSDHLPCESLRARLLA
jgi:hypothetical protein